MRLLQIVIVTLIVAYPDVVLSSKVKKRSISNKKENGPCGKRYLRQINGKCYYLAGKKMNWYGAQNNCLRKGLNLADLATEEEFNAIINVLRLRGMMEDYWFGGNDLQTEGRFTYISTGRLVRYYGGQATIEPTHRANLDDCLEVRLRDNGTTVIDDNCLEEQYFVCQENPLKCANPVDDRQPNEHHSHEHLHHFHHDAAQAEQVNETSVKSDESDSRPVDVSDVSLYKDVSEEATAESSQEEVLTITEDLENDQEDTAITDAVTGITPPGDSAVPETAEGDGPAVEIAEPVEGADESTETAPTADPGEPVEGGEESTETEPAAEPDEPVEGGEETTETEPAAEPDEPVEGGEETTETEPAAEPDEPVEGGEETTETEPTAEPDEPVEGGEESTETEPTAEPDEPVEGGEESTETEPTAEPDEPVEGGEESTETEPNSETDEPVEGGEESTETEPNSETAEPVEGGEESTETEPNAETAEPVEGGEETTTPDEETPAARAPKAQTPPTGPKLNSTNAAPAMPSDGLGIIIPTTSGLNADAAK